MASSIIEVAENIARLVDNQYDINQITLFLNRYIRSERRVENYTVEQLKLDALDYINWLNINQNSLPVGMDPLIAFSTSTIISIPEQVKNIGQDANVADIVKSAGITLHALLTAAIVEGKLNLAEYLINNTSFYLYKFLKLAVRNNQADIVRILLRKGFYTERQLNKVRGLTGDQVIRNLIEAKIRDEDSGLISYITEDGDEW